MERAAGAARRSIQVHFSHASRAPSRVIIAERGSLAERMAQELQRLGAEAAEQPSGPSPVDPETRERLAALGYIGSFVNTVRKAGEALPDPKDRIDVFNLMTSR